MVPITHILYLAVGLFVAGLGGLLLTRRVLGLWLSIEVLVIACCLMLVAFARQWGSTDGQVLAVVMFALGTQIVVFGAHLTDRLGVGRTHLADIDREGD